MTIHITTEEDKGKCLIEQARAEGRKQGIEEALRVVRAEIAYCNRRAKRAPDGSAKSQMWNAGRLTAAVIEVKIKELVNHGSPLQDSATETHNKEITH